MTSRNRVDIQEKAPRPSEPPKVRRTRIEDISEFGYELSEEHLRLVTGGMMATGGSCTSPGMCDD